MKVLTAQVDVTRPKQKCAMLVKLDLDKTDASRLERSTLLLKKI